MAFIQYRTSKRDGKVAYLVEKVRDENGRWKNVWKKLGPIPPGSRKKLRRELLEKRTLMKVGLQPVVHRSLAKMVQDYLTAPSRLVQETKDREVSHLKLFGQYVPRGHEKPLNQWLVGKAENEKVPFVVEARHIEEYLTAKECKARTKNIALTTMRSMWDYAIERGYAAVNPARSVKLFKVEKLPPKYLTWDQIETILGAMSLESRAKYECLLNLGVRPKELSMLCLGDIDLERGHVTIRHTKTRTFRTIPINGRLRPYLERLKKEVPVLDRWKPREHHNLLFYNWAVKGREVQIKSFKSSLQRVLNKLEWKTKGVSPYIFRHSFASHITARGINIRVVQELLGHSSIVMTQRYAHAFPEDLRSGVEVLNRDNANKLDPPL